jgi:hypothetical protein
MRELSDEELDLPRGGMNEWPVIQSQQGWDEQGFIDAYPSDNDWSGFYFGPGLE